MTQTCQTISYPNVTLTNSVAKPFQLYSSAIGGLANFGAWWDLLDTTGLITVASSNISAAAAWAGSGNLTQSSSGLRPGYDSTNGANFAGGQALIYSGTFPASDHTVVAIVSIAATGVAENLLGSQTGGTATSHRLFAQSNGTMRYAVNTSFADTPMVTGLALVMADFVQSTGVVRTRINGATPTASGVTTGTGSLVSDWYVGNVSDSATNAFNGRILDIGLFNAAIIGTPSETMIKNYFRQVRGGVTA